VLKYGQPNPITVIKIIKRLKIFTIKIHGDLIILLNFFKEQKNIFKYSNVNLLLFTFAAINYWNYVKCRFWMYHTIK